MFVNIGLDFLPFWQRGMVGVLFSKVVKDPMRNETVSVVKADNNTMLGLPRWGVIREECICSSSNTAGSSPYSNLPLLGCHRDDSIERRLEKLRCQ